MAQDNVLKQPAQMPAVQNASGQESGVSPENEWSATAGEKAVGGGPTGNDGINGDASSENLSAKFKYPNVSQDIPEAGRNQYE